jgi:hypothetical protein
VSGLVIIASDLYFAAPAVHGIASESELPSLTRLARWGTRRALPGDWRAWLAAYLPRAELADMAPATVAASAGGAALEANPVASVWLAEPVHLTAGLRSLHLPHHGRIRPDAPMQERLRAAFAVAFSACGYELVPLAAGRFVLAAPQTIGEVVTTDPARALGASIADALPRGENARALRSLGSEIEMWLHEHPLNIERVRARLPTISTLWLWGAGPPPPPALASNEAFASEIPPPSTALIGDDPYVAGLAKLNGLAWRPLPSRFPEAIGRRSVIVAEVFAGGADREETPLEALARFDREWVAPALAAVARGDVAQLTLIANDRSVSFATRHRLRFWRAPRRALEALA